MPGAKGCYPQLDLTHSKILVVDDDRLVLKSLQRILLADGYEVECSSSAQEALESMAVQPPDVILLDMMMPMMNGRQFLQALHNNASLAHIPVVVITGVRGIDIKQARSMGACDVIEKPFNIEQLLDKVALVLFRNNEPVPTPPTAVVDASDPSSGTIAQSFRAPPDAGPVLLVSADDALTRRFEQLVEPAGYELVSLMRVREELAIVASALFPTAVVVDLHIPGTPGMQALRDMRAQDDLDSVPILLLARDEHALRAVRDELVPLSIGSLVHPFDDRDIQSFLAHPPADARRG